MNAGQRLTISLVLLTLNEFESVRQILPRIPAGAGDEMFVVDGGSTDGTRELFASWGIPVIVQDLPGRGEAFRTAVRNARGDAIIFFSPDGNEDPADILRMRLYFEAGYDMVIASRLMPEAWNEEDEKVIKLRKWFVQAVTLAANLLWNRRALRQGRGYVTDTINGFRGIRKSAFHLLELDVADYTVEFQMSIQAMKRDLRIAEFPTIERPRLAGRSKVRSLEGGLRFLKTLLREVRRGPTRLSPRPGEERGHGS